VCSTPMVVWKRHGTEPDPADIEWMVQCLMEAAVERFGDEVTKVDRVMRQIPEHFHAHAPGVFVASPFHDTFVARASSLLTSCTWKAC
jgi:predicted NodU family carbamoyl transferase